LVSKIFSVCSVIVIMQCDDNVCMGVILSNDPRTNIISVILLLVVCVVCGYKCAISGFIGGGLLWWCG
jgi:hypothetical protein